MSHNTSCPFFDKLPAELRLDIYTLTFDIDHSQEANLLEAKPPSKALLITCKRAHAEARAIHSQAHRNYWMGTKFIIPDGRREHTVHEINALQRIYSQDLHHIAHLRIFRPARRNEPTEWCFDLLDSRGGWCFSNEYSVYLIHVRSSKSSRSGRRRVMQSRAELDQKLRSGQQVPLHLQILGVLQMAWSE